MNYVVDKVKEEQKEDVSILTHPLGGEALEGLGVRPYVAVCEVLTPIVYSNGRTIIPLEGAESCRVAVWLLIVRA